MKITLGDKLEESLNNIAASEFISMSDIFRKSLQLYVEAKKAQNTGMKLYLVDSDNDQNRTEIIGF